MINRIRTRFSIRFTVVTAFALTMLLILSIAVSLQYYFTQKLATEAALSQFQFSAAATRDYLKRLDRQTMQTARILSKIPNMVNDNWIVPQTTQLFAETMQTSPLLYAIYLGFENGDFYELINLNTHASIRRKLQAIESDRWVEIKVYHHADKGRVRQFDYYNEAFERRASRIESSDYDARKRHWFIHAETHQVRKSAPYLFQHLQAPGQTYSIRLANNQAVLALDITDVSLSEYLDQLPIQQNAEIFIYQPDGDLSASNHTIDDKRILPKIQPLSMTASQHAYLKNLPSLKVSNELNWPPIDYAISGEPQGYAIDVLKLIAQALNIKLEFINGYSWPELFAMFQRGEIDILHPLLTHPTRTPPGLLSHPIMSAPHTLATQLGVAPIRDINQLNGHILALPRGWSIIPIFETYFPDIRILQVDTTVEALQAVAQGHAFATLDIDPVIRYTAKQYFIDKLQFHEHLDIEAKILPQTLHLVVQPTYQPLLSLINDVLVQIDAQHREALHNKWLNTATTNTTPNPAVVPYSELIDLAHAVEQHNQLHALRLNGEKKRVFVTSLNEVEAHNATFFAIVVDEKTIVADAMSKVKTSLLLSLLTLLLLLPLAWLFANPIVRPIKRLAQENHKISQRRYDEVVLCDSVIKEVYELAQSLVEMSHAQQQHEQQQTHLLESLVKMLAQAIDDKSPHTARHCARVPELSMMLAEAAETSQQPAFKAFQFLNEDERREFHMAAWLHDCGKITTPEHIINKGTKLECIYNRLHEVRMRFEVLWRDAEIDCLKQQQAHPEQAQQLAQTLHQQQRQLQADFAFIAELNSAHTPVNFDDIARLQVLAKRRWWRHFDNRLGLSSEELARFNDTDTNLPVEEPLLSDRPEHLIPHSHSTDYAPELGINMAIPTYQTHLGELHNLSITQGTLTEEDRFKIDEHVISTIRMLTKLPFPAEYARVPRYASTHHETLNGQGYPRGLNAEHLSIPERIIAIADIFEALTAADRPYKKAKTIKQALDIIYDDVEAGRLDRDVFELFIESGVYLDYAQRYLTPQQIVPVSLEDYRTPF